MSRMTDVSTNHRICLILCYRINGDARGSVCMADSGFAEHTSANTYKPANLYLLVNYTPHYIYTPFGFPMGKWRDDNVIMASNDVVLKS